MPAEGGKGASMALSINCKGKPYGVLSLTENMLIESGHSRERSIAYEN
jgi:hypothetical protein